MRTHYAIFALFFLSNYINAQGFELIFGENDGFHMAHKVVEIPDQDAYLVIDQGPSAGSPTSTLNLTKIDLFGNIISTVSYPFLYFYTFSTLEVLCKEQTFIVAIGNQDVINIVTFDYSGLVLSNIEHNLSSNFLLREMRFFSDQSIIFSETLNDQFHLTKLSSDGTVIWEKKNVLSNVDYGHDILVLPNDEFLVINPRLTTTLYKFDVNGELLWQNDELVYPPERHYMIAFPDSDVYLTYGLKQDLSGAHISAFSTDGELLWSQDFSNHIQRFVRSSVIQGESNTLYLTGPAGLNNKQVLLELDDKGTILWKEQYEGFNSFDAGQLLRDDDGGFIIATIALPGNEFGSSPYILKIDEARNLTWSWYEKEKASFSRSDAIISEDGGYLILGNRAPFSNSTRLNYVVKLDPNGNVYTRQINGQLVFDNNLSCDLDADEQTLSEWVIQVEGRQTLTEYTDDDGYFSIDCNADTVVLSAMPLNDLWEACPEEIPVVFASFFDTVSVNPTMQAIGDCPAIDLDISAPFVRRCFDNTYYVHLKNNGTLRAEDLQISIKLDTFFTLAAVSISDYTIIDQLLQVTIGDLEIDEEVQFSFEVYVSCDAPLGQIHCVSASSDMSNGCMTILYPIAFEYSQVEECQPNIGAFDPNDKRGFTAGVFTERYITSGAHIDYQIRFQNTGTDTAFNIVILDTLSELLDITTFKLGVSSHSVKASFDRHRGLKFTFNNIALADSSTDEAASHGFVKFKIRPLPDLSPGNVITNRAAIYFDFNEAVLTNTLELEIESISGISKKPQIEINYLTVFPQPAHSVVNFHYSVDKFNNQDKQWIEIFDISGKLIRKEAIRDPTFKIDQLSEGIYIFRLLNSSSILESGKFIVVK